MLKFYEFFDKKIVGLIKGAGLHFVFYALNLIIVYLLAIIIAKFFGPEVYGRYSIIKSSLMILIIVATLGTNTLAVKMASDELHYSNHRYKTNFVRKSYFLILITSLLIALVIFGFREELATFVFADKQLERYFYIFPVLFLAISFLNYNSNLLKGQKRVLAFSFLNTFFNNFIFLSAILICVFTLGHTEENVIIYGFPISVLIACVVSIIKIFPIKYFEVKKKISYREILARSIPMMMSASMIYFILSSDIIILGLFETSKKVGVYRVITQIASVNTIFLIVFGVILSPQISSLYASKKNVALKELIEKSVKIIFYVTLPISLIIILFSKELLSFFGSDFEKEYLALILLCGFQFFYTISGFVDIILNMTGNERIFGKITFFTATLNIILNLITIPYYGVLGAAFSTGISIVFTNIISLYIINKRLKIKAIYLPFLNKKDAR